MIDAIEVMCTAGRETVMFDLLSEAVMKGYNNVNQAIISNDGLIVSGLHLRYDIASSMSRTIAILSKR